MRLSYFFGGEFSQETAQDFAHFLNSTNNYPEPVDIIDFYIRSIGGDLECYMAIKDMIENSEVPIHIRVCGQASSAAFMLLYFTDNCLKSLAPSAYSIVHFATMIQESRDLLDNKGLSKKLIDFVNAENENLLKQYKKLKVLTTSQLNTLSKGGDVILLYEDLAKIMSKCPYGEFIKEGEKIIIENKSSDNQDIILEE